MDYSNGDDGRFSLGILSTETKPQGWAHDFNKKRKCRHDPIRSCLCETCKDHFTWLDLHLRAMAEHEAEKRREFLATDQPNV